MAGIGFRLKELFDSRGVLPLCRAYGYAGMIAAGPMLLGAALLLGVSFGAKLGGMGEHDRKLLNCMLTYSLLASLSVTSWWSMAVTRYVSDMLYENRRDRVMPAFYGSTAVMLAVCLLLYGTFLRFSGVPLTFRILCLRFSLVLTVVWNQMVFLTAVKDYESLVLSFAVSLMAGFLLLLVLILLGYVTIEAFLGSVTFAYGLLMCKYMKVLLEDFPKQRGSSFSFLAWMDRYRPLAVTGGMLHIGLFSHLILMYFGPMGQQVEGLFYAAPQYDVPALFAYFSLLVTTVTFVTSVEVKFYPRYRRYYGLFNGSGTVADIRQAEEEMVSVLRRELVYTGHRQVFATILFIVMVPPVLQTLPLGFTDGAVSVFRFLCVGYGTYAVANSVMLIQLYFEDYRGAVAGALLFAVFSTAVTAWQVFYGQTRFFGAGFFAGAAVFYGAAAAGLQHRSRRLPYYSLSRQSLLPRRVRGPMIRIAEKLDRRAENREGRVSL